jgi:hypothetical protein
MIRFMLCQDGKTENGGTELLVAWREAPGNWLWIDLQDEPVASETELLVGQLGLDAHAVIEAQRPRHPPGFESYPDYIYLLSKPLTSDSEDLDFSTQQMALFAGQRLLSPATASTHASSLPCSSASPNRVAQASRRSASLPPSPAGWPTAMARSCWTWSIASMR